MQGLLNRFLMILHFCSPIKETCGRATSMDYSNTNVNVCVDKFFKILNEMLDDVFKDDHKLPDAKTSFTYKLIKTFSADVSLSEGMMMHQPYILRDGPIKFKVTKNRMVLEVPLMGTDLRFKYAYRVSVMGLSPSGVIIGEIDNLRAMIQVGFDNSTAELVLNVDIIEESGDIAVIYEKDSTHWLMQPLSNALLYFFKSKIMTLTEKIVSEELDDLLVAVNNDIKMMHQTPLLWAFFDKLAKNSAKANVNT